MFWKDQNMLWITKFQKVGAEIFGTALAAYNETVPSLLCL